VTPPLTPRYAGSWDSVLSIANGYLALKVQLSATGAPGEDFT